MIKYCLMSAFIVISLLGCYNNSAYTINNYSLHKNTDSIAGVYKLCPFHCLIVEVKPDLTFSLKLVGDLYIGENADGKLIPLGNNHYLANSNFQPIPPQEYITNRKDLFISVKDQNNEGLAFSFIRLNDLDTTFITDSLGTLSIPKIVINKISVSMITTFNYKIANSFADSICIKQPFYPDKIIIQNEEWVFRNDSLFMPNIVGIERVKE